MIAPSPAGLSRGRELALLGAILLLAGVLRLGWPGVTEFKRDEAALYGLALDVAEFKALPLRGIGSSVGLPNAPASVYVFALPLFLWPSPLAATLFVGALNTASVALAYVMARRYWGVRAALLAALLYAAAPWGVLYSRKIWAQNLLPLFVVGYVFTALLALVEGRRRWLVAHLVLLALIAQLHLSGLAFVPLTALLLGLYRRNVDWRLAGWGALAAAATLVPIGLYAAQQAGATGMGALTALLAQPAAVTGDSLWLATLVALGLEAHSLAGAQAFRAFLATVPNFDPLLYLEGALAVGGAAVALAQRFRKAAGPEARQPAREAGLIVVLWLLVPILVFVRHSTPVFPHYFILLFPAPYLLAGLALDAALSRWPRFGPLAVITALAIAAAQVWLVAALLGFIGARATPGAFGTPLRLLLDVAGRARSAPEVVIVSDGADPGHAEVPAVFDVLLRGIPHRFVDGRTTAVLPAGDAAVVVWPGAGPYPGAELIETWGGGWAETVPLRAGEGAVRIARFAGASLGPPQPRAASALLANGVEVALWWRAPDGAADAEAVTIFAHLLDAQGQRLAQADVPTYPVGGWRAGDLVVSYFALAGEGTTVRVGMYGAQSRAPVDVLDAAGNPAGQWLEFPLSLP